MKPGLSVFSALRESFYLWTQNFWIFTVIAVATGLPQLALWHLQTMLAPIPRPSHFTAGSISTMAVFLLTTFAVYLILSAISTAAILGILGRPAPDSLPWPAMRRSIAANTWSLCCVGLALCLVFIIPRTLVMVSLPLFRIIPTHRIDGLFLGLYAIMVKFALADPLVVVERKRAGAALGRSWQMTRGAFWYVLGCYVFFPAIDQLLHWLFKSIHFLSSLPSLFGVLVNLVYDVVSPFSVIVSWVMYNQIKAARPDDTALTAQTPAP
jgi:hypothetical protein